MPQKISDEDVVLKIDKNGYFVNTNNVVQKVLRDKRLSKAEKTKRGSALSSYKRLQKENFKKEVESDMKVLRKFMNDPVNDPWFVPIVVSLFLSLFLGYFLFFHN